MSRKEFLEYARQGGKVPDLRPPPYILPLTQYFDGARSFAGHVDNPLTMDVIEGWQRHTDIVLEKWERNCLFAMDRAFRRAFADVVKYHAERPQVKTK